jgi:hypothetical protein
MTAEGSTCEKIEAWWDTAQDLSFFLLSETSSDVVLNSAKMGNRKPG